MLRAHLLFGFASIAAGAFAQLPGLVISGNPEAGTGATWTYQATVSGTNYDLSGILRKPPGAGPFPAVVINHGTGGNANGYTRSVANEMVAWNYVGIGTNLTHAGGVPCGAPGDCVTEEYGSSAANILRAMKCRDILASLGYVDTMCIASFGHSRGAWLTTGLVAAHPDKFSVAGHTAGGVNDAPQSTAPSAAEAASITCPYIIQHGDADNTVPLSWDERLDSVLTANGVDHQFIVFPGYTHAGIAQDVTMFANAQAWFALHGCPISTALPIAPAPANGHVLSREWFDASGRRVPEPTPGAGAGIFLLRERMQDGSVVLRRIAGFP